MRLGWPAFNIEVDLFACDPIEFFHALASGESTRGAHRLNEVATGVVMALPPYPHSPRDYEEIVGVPLYNAPETGWHPCEIQAGDEASMLSAGHYLGIAVGTAETVRQASNRAYRILRKISMPASPFYRNDIGKGLARQLPLLQQHGFATGLEY
jgi:phosphoribosylamine-glycine ligase